MPLEKLIIGAPFGNYITMPFATSTLGTFTKEFRAGPLKRLWRVLKTVRYYPALQAWKNKLGLPNPGLETLFDVDDVEVYVNKIISISARTTDDWLHLLRSARCLRPAAVELNVSCPNTPYEVDKSNYAEVFGVASAELDSKVIVKLPPVGYETITDMALNAGVRGFHCCNTLPTPGGGLSGKPLQLLALEAVRHVSYVSRRSEGKTVIIGGGGVTEWDDYRRFRDAGATNVSVASVLFFPWRWARIRNIAIHARHS